LTDINSQVNIDRWIYNDDTLNSNMCCDTIYSDFEKAFDNVRHRRVISKLRGYVIRDAVLNWI